MKRLIVSVLVIFVASFSLFAQNDAPTQKSTLSEERLLLDGWKFSLGVTDPAEEVSLPAYDDSRWETVTIPHDWAVAGPFDKDIDKQVVAIVQNNEGVASEKTGRSGSLPWIGEGWYRRAFDVPAGVAHVSLVFDGAMSEPQVYVNGQLAGVWAYGYNCFEIDVTPYVKEGANTLAVHLNNRPESSRWYPGAGLFRPVRLRTAPEIRFDTWGVFARTTQVSGIDSAGMTAECARLSVNSEICVDFPLEKGHKLYVLNEVFDGRGQKVGENKREVSDSKEAASVVLLKNVSLWSPENPVRYRLVTTLSDARRVWDRRETQIGIRDLYFGPEGFRLNAQPRKFQGVCLHHDLGPLGAAFNKSAFARQVAILKDMGCDAIRTSHNVPAPWQLDVCDSMGMMVMAESFDMWIWPKCKNGYSLFFTQENPNPQADGRQRQWWESDVENLVRCHRNHPSVVMWSIGNEIPEQGNANGLKYTRLMQEICHRLDPSRPVTMGLDRGEAPIWSGTFQELDVPGFNYRLPKYGLAAEASPKGILLGTETASTVSSRGVYKFPPRRNWGDTYDDGQCSSYDLGACSWSNLPDDDWLWQDDAPWVIGEFVWTGFDYLGEPTPYDTYWPSRSSYFGIVDLAGLPKDRFYLYRSRWNRLEKTVHLLPHWTWPGRRGQTTPVYCYTDCPEAELFVNGVSQGRRRKADITLDQVYGEGASAGTASGKSVLDAAKGKTAVIDPDPVDRYRLRWNDVVYEPGEIRVVVYDEKGAQAGEEVLRTAGKASRIELSADRTRLRRLPLGKGGESLDCPDLAFVTVTLTDRDGNVCPDADNLLTFSVKGSGKFKACCNGDATSVESFVEPQMKVFHGMLVVVLEAGSKPGPMTLTVNGKGLKTSKLVLNVE